MLLSELDPELIFLVAALERAFLSGSLNVPYTLYREPPIKIEDQCVERLLDNRVHSDFTLDSFLSRVDPHRKIVVGHIVGRLLG